MGKEDFLKKWVKLKKDELEELHKRHLIEARTGLVGKTVKIIDNDSHMKKPVIVKVKSVLPPSSKGTKSKNVFDLELVDKEGRFSIWESMEVFVIS